MAAKEGGSQKDKPPNDCKGMLSENTNHINYENHGMQLFPDNYDQRLSFVLFLLQKQHLHVRHRSALIQLAPLY